MRGYAGLVTGVFFVALLTVANMQLNAEDGCGKYCGAGEQQGLGTRPGCTDGSCAWIECAEERHTGCDGPFNDDCGTPDPCDVLVIE
jgi:hypothetical protein